MLIRNVKIGPRLLLVVAIALLFLVALGGYGINAVSVINQDMSKGLDLADKAKRSIDLARSAQVDFKIQVQEWKNILIRGNNPENYKKYFESFKKHHALVQDKLQSLKNLIEKININTDSTVVAIKSHAELFDKYAGALNNFDAADDQAGKNVDKIVTGIDRAPTERIDKVVDEIFASTEAMQAQGVAESNAVYQRAKLTFTICMAVALVVLSLIAFVIIRTITKPLGRTVAFSEAVAKGRLDEELEVAGADEIGALAASLRRMVASLKEMIAVAEDKSQVAARETEKSHVATADAEAARARAETAKNEGMLDCAERLTGVTSVLSLASEELAAQVEQSSRGASAQAGRVGEIATAMEEMNASVLEIAGSAIQAAKTAEQAKEDAKTGQTAVGRVVETIGRVQSQAQSLKADMAGLGVRAEGIGRVLNVISDIADQTNLLALNAAIEAARAGDAGRGFAVVADEVRKLAEKTMTATKEVGEAIGGIQQQTRLNVANVDTTVQTIGEAAALAGQSGDLLLAIVSLVDQTSDQVRSIATASEEQSAASEEINRSITDVNQIVGDTSEAMRQSAKAVTEVAAQAQTLAGLIGSIRSECGAPAQASPRSACAPKALN